MSYLISLALTREEVRSLRAKLEDAPTNQVDLDSIYQKLNAALTPYDSTHPPPPPEPEDG